jgi:uncharacterized membrane protein
MSKDVSDLVRDAVGRAAREALRNMGDANPVKNKKSGGLSGVRGLAAGAGLAALVPLAKKGVDAVRNGGLPSLNPADLAGDAASKVGDKVSDVAGDKVDEAGGASGMLKNAVGGAMPFGGDNDDDSQSDGMPGVGKGRRMPVQQAVDVAVPLEVAYNQWTQYEDWPQFMHRVTRVTQDEETEVSFATKIWGKTKEFKAEIVTQRPDDRVKWRVTEGITHTGVVSFHELAPRLTRIEIDLDVDPGSLIEKAARGMRHIKRAVRADLHRFKSYIEMQEIESGAWRGTIEDGEVIEEHDESYDKDRDYAEVDDIYDFASPADQGEDDDGDEDQDDNGQAERSKRFKRQAEESSGRSSKPKARSAAASKPAASRSASSSRSRSNGSKNGKSTASKSSSSRSRGGSARKSSSGSRSKSAAKS